jgi:RNA polymerase sigma factor (sigma-70 family)
MILNTGENRFPSESSALPALVAAAIDGDERAWSALVARFSSLVTSVVRRFRLTPADADDIAQTVWLCLIEHLADLREPRALPGWIVTTTRREAKRVLSGDRRVEPVDPQADHRLDRIDRRDVAADLLSAERRQAVRDGLSELPTRHRELLLLTVADPDIPYRQISRRLGIPTGSIGPTRARTLRKLGDSEPVRALAS